MREQEWERAVTVGMDDPDTLAEEIEAQEFHARQETLHPTTLELAGHASRHARATDPVPPGYVKRSAA